MLKEILEYNQQFVRNKEYDNYLSDKYPDKKMVIFSCMDTRLTELLPRAMNLRNGDAKIIKNAGAIISHPFGSVMRSIAVAVYELDAEEICVVGHHGCGMASIDPAKTIDKMVAKGIQQETLTILKHSGIDLRKWLQGFDCVRDSVLESVKIIRNHPLIPRSVAVHGLVIDPRTGELELLSDGNAPD